jgi:hypothetical protein
MSLHALYPAHRHPDSVPDKVVGDTLSHRPWAPLLAGAAAGIIGWIATFPFDILKIRLRVGAGAGLDTALGTSWRTARRCTPNMANASFDAFWCSPSYAVPVSMAMFSTLAHSKVSFRHRQECKVSLHLARMYAHKPPKNEFVRGVELRM